MRKFYFAKQKTYIYAITSAVIIILLAAITVNVLALLRVGNMLSKNPTVDLVASIVMFLVCVILSSFTFLSGYKIYETKISCKYSYFFTYLDINYDSVLLVRMNSKKNMLLLYVETNEELSDVEDSANGLKANIVQIKIKPNQIDTFVSQIKKHAPNIVIEIVQNEE